MIRLLKAAANSNNTPRSRGTFGEMIVASIFDRRFFGDEERYIINDIILQTSENKTHQIDHVVIYKTGIFCIETKNINGLILGHPDVKKWNVVNKKETYNILNPIIQNNKHVKVLSKFIGNQFDVHSIIVFIKGNKPKDCGEELLNIQELKDYVKNYPCKAEISSKNMKNIYEILTTCKNDSGVSLKEHIENIEFKE